MPGGGVVSGPSKYEPLAMNILTSYGADAVVLAVVGGSAGTGCCRAVEPVAATPETRAALAQMLRMVADAIERESVPQRLVRKPEPT